MRADRLVAARAALARPIDRALRRRERPLPEPDVPVTLPTGDFDGALAAYLDALGFVRRNAAPADTRTQLLRKLERPLYNHLTGIGLVAWKRAMVHGPAERLHVEEKRPLNINAIYNTRSGHIWIGAGTIIGHSCMFLTGRHVFEDGRLRQPRSEQVPNEGYDIRIGEGCWIASGAIVVGGVTIDDHSVVAAGAVVTSNVASGSIVGGVPAHVIGRVA